MPMTEELCSRREEVLLAQQFAVFIASDSAFQRRARLMQSLWRDVQGYPIGEHRGTPLGSRLAMPWAEDTLANYLTETIREVVRREVFGRRGDQQKLFGYPRIVNDLLSSQPLCFNLFGELQQDLPLASCVIADLTQGRASEVTRIEFEHSPGRGDLAYTGDASAFDVFIEYRTPAGGIGFLGVEVKYHENLQNPAARHRPRYDEVAEAMGCFRQDAWAALREKPLQQIWRDHLLAGSLLMRGEHDEGQFVFLSPQENTHCAQAVTAYQACLTRQESFANWTLEAVCDALQRHSDAAWIAMFTDRYLNFAKVAAIAADQGQHAAK